MIGRFSKALTEIIAASSLMLILASGPASAQDRKLPQVKDQGEYDLVLAVQKESNPQEKMELLRRWEQKYPSSEFKSQRSIQMARTDGQMMTKWLLYGGSTAETEVAMNAARDLLNNIDRYLAPENKPANTTDEQWKQVRQKLEQQASAVLKQ